MDSSRRFAELEPTALMWVPGRTMSTEKSGSLAWVAVMMPASAGLVVHGVMLLVCYAVDRRIYPTQGLAHWLTLRFRLSAVAALSCFLGAAGT